MSTIAPEAPPGVSDKELATLVAERKATPRPDLATAVKAVLDVERALNSVVIEQPEYVNALVLAPLADVHVYACGTGGTGKTFGAERTAEAFDLGVFYTILRPDMKREEVWGPLSMKGLTEDRYEHATAGFAPDYPIWILDEIADAGQFLRQFLRALNERKFVNGNRDMALILRAAFGLTNFWIEEPHLQALFDRLGQRIIAEPVKTRSGFEKILAGQIERRQGKSKPLPKLSPAVVDVIREARDQVDVPDDVRKVLSEKYMECRKQNVATDASPRRWGEFVKVAQVIAVLNGESQVSEGHLAAPLRRGLLDHPDNVQVIRDLTKDLVDRFAQKTEEGQKALAELRKELQPIRDAKAAGQTPDFTKLSEAWTNANTLVEKLQGMRKEVTGQGRDATQVDELLAAAKEELVFATRAAGIGG